MRKILFPIDGSCYGKAAMAWGVRFLDNLASEIHVLIVSEALEVDYSLEQMRDILEEAKDYFENHGFKVPHVEYRINRKAREAICEYAREQDIDCIIMSSHGSQLAQRVVGSVSQYVLTHAERPVLVIRHARTPEMQLSHPEAAQDILQAERGRPLKILLPVDTAHAAEAVLSMTGGLLKPASEICLLHVANPNLERYALASVQREAENLLETARTFLESRNFRVIATEVRVGNPADEIIRYADEQRVDEIVMAAHENTGIQRFLFGSVSNEVLKRAHQPVLVFRSGDQPMVTISHVDQVDLYQNPE